MPLWRTIGHATWIIRARTLPKTLAILGLIAGIILGLTFIPKEFDLEAEGTLMAEERREVFAPIDGEVIAVNVVHKQMVKQGDVLIQLRNHEMEIQLNEIDGEILTTHAEMARVESQKRMRKQMDDAEKNALLAEQRELETRMRVLQDRRALQAKRAADLTIRSPIDGIVVSWDPDKTLRSRPIMTGQVLLEIVDLSQPMYLELELPEKRVGHLDDYIAKNNLTGPDAELEVEYILGSYVDHPLQAALKVSTISARADTQEEHGSIVKMRVDPDQQSLSELKPLPGAKVIADVKCGSRSSGFVFLHEVYEWCCKFFF